MQTVLSPLVNVYQTQLEASRRFADAIFAGTEKIDRVLLDATHRMVNQQLTLAQAMAGVRDPQSAATTWQSNFLSRSPDETMNYQKQIMRIFAEMQNEMGKSLQEYVEQLGSSAAGAATSRVVETKTLQSQASESVYNPVTSMFSVWESAFKEAAALARKNMVAARSTIEDAANRTIENAAAVATATGDGMESAVKRASEKSSMGADGEDGDRSRGGKRK